MINSVEPHIQLFVFPHSWLAGTLLSNGCYLINVSGLSFGVIVLLYRQGHGRNDFYLQTFVRITLEPSKIKQWELTCIEQMTEWMFVCSTEHVVICSWKKSFGALTRQEFMWSQAGCPEQWRVGIPQEVRHWWELMSGDDGFADGPLEACGDGEGAGAWALIWKWINSVREWENCE